MFTHIVTQVSGRLTALFTQALALLKELLWLLVSYLLASCILVSLSVVKLYNLVVRIVLSTKALLVNLITQALSINRALISAKVKALLLGLQRLIIAPQTNQAAPTPLSRKRGRPVGSTKSAQSRSKGSKIALTHTVPQSTQGGLKYQGHAKPHRQHAKQPSKAKH
jgi:hypothetical protein